MAFVEKIKTLLIKKEELLSSGLSGLIDGNHKDCNRSDLPGSAAAEETFLEKFGVNDSLDWRLCFLFMGWK